MMRVIEKKDGSFDGSIVAAKNALSNWLECFRVDANIQRERFLALGTIVRETTGNAGFLPHSITLMSSALNKRYFTQKPVLVDKAIIAEGSDEGEYKGGDYTAHFYLPSRDRKIEAEHGAAFGFAHFQSTNGTRVDEPRFPFAKDVKTTVCPAIFVDQDFLQTMRTQGVLDKFTEHFGRIVEDCNHDWLHSMTNFPAFVQHDLFRKDKVRGWKFPYVISEMKTAEAPGNGMAAGPVSIEEHILLGISSQIFARIRAQGDSNFVDRLVHSTRECMTIMDELNGKGQIKAADTIKGLLWEFLGNYIEPESLTNSDPHTWADLIKTGPIHCSPLKMLFKGRPSSAAEFFSQTSDRMHADMQTYLSASEGDGIQAVAYEIAGLPISTGRATSRPGFPN